MFVIITGPRASGKRSVQDYLVRWKGFEALRLVQSTRSVGSADVKGVGLGLGVGVGVGLQAVATTSLGQNMDGSPSVSVEAVKSPETGIVEETVTKSSSETTMVNSPLATPASFLSLSSSCASPFAFANGDENTNREEVEEVLNSRYSERVFSDAMVLLDFVTANWRSDFVTLDITTQSLLDPFVVRPFVLVLSVEAPLMTRYDRCIKRGESVSLEEFIKDHDNAYFSTSDNSDPITPAYLYSNRNISHLNVINSFSTLWALHDHLELLNIQNPERLRPGWDPYFMTLASLASHRSNCMKRRVGAILVRENRIVSTGYNGTPRGVLNCNQGGCRRCNKPDITGIEDECLCLHAEENALLEAGRERVGKGAVLYCNTCPCLKCTIKIVQTGVTEVVYNFSYKMDTASATLFTNAGVKLRQFSPPT